MCAINLNKAFGCFVFELNNENESLVRPQVSKFPTYIYCSHTLPKLATTTTTTITITIINFNQTESNLNSINIIYYLSTIVSILKLYPISCDSHNLDSIKIQIKTTNCNEKIYEKKEKTNSTNKDVKEKNYKGKYRTC